jgi:short-chain fatty acids transporter
MSVAGDARERPGAILELRARHVMGFTFLVFVLLAPVVLVLVTASGATLAYPL